MSNIKVSELFYSLQGEGQYIGTPSIFLRVFGCNFTCSSFSMPRGELSQERLAIDPSKYEHYDDLPLVHTGCDSYASWDVRFKHLSPVLTIKAIADRIQELLPDGKFSNDKHLILTGGEPLLGWQRAYPALFDEFHSRGMDLTQVTFETNGTQELNNDLINSIRNHELEVTFSVSSKLPGSGEKWDDAIKPEIIKQYYNVGDLTYFKWVVSDQSDYEDVVRAVNEYTDILGFRMLNIPVYLMPAGGTTMHYDKNEKWVADLAMKHGWRYSPRLQVLLWANAWAT
jgi:organic radical activating enzyme